MKGTPSQLKCFVPAFTTIKGPGFFARPHRSMIRRGKMIGAIESLRISQRLRMQRKRFLESKNFLEIYFNLFPAPCSIRISMVGIWD